MAALTVKEILDQLADQGVTVQAAGGGLVSSGRPGHNRRPAIRSLLNALLKKHDRDPDTVERQLRSSW